jgi:Holliday junction resolvase RusA-like endonuclease
MTGIVYLDDSQIVSIIARKAYGPQARTFVRIRPLTA